MRTAAVQWLSISGLAAGCGGSRDALLRQLSEPTLTGGAILRLTTKCGKT